MKEILFFDEMITPKIITVVYWLLLLGVVVSSLSMMFGNYGGFFAGLGALIGGAISVRIFCELTIVLFKVNESLKTIASK